MCLRPVKAYYNENEKDIQFRRPNNPLWRPIELPCGRCIECRKKVAAEWSQRLCLEYKNFNKGVFLTLTYDDEHIKRNHYGIETLDKRDITLFIKKLRKHMNFKYFCIGEYGSISARPHYHLIILGITKEELLTKWNKSSPIIEKLWQNGNNYIAEVNEKTIAYTTQYCIKKLKDTDEEINYNKLEIERPFRRASKGIGEEYYINKKERILNNDGYIYINGHQSYLSKYIINKYREELEEQQEKRKKLGAFYNSLNDDYTKKEKRAKMDLKKMLHKNSI